MGYHNQVLIISIVANSFEIVAEVKEAKLTVTGFLCIYRKLRA